MSLGLAAETTPNLGATFDTTKIYDDDGIKRKNQGKRHNRTGVMHNVFFSVGKFSLSMVGG